MSSVCRDSIARASVAPLRLVFWQPCWCQNKTPPTCTNTNTHTHKHPMYKIRRRRPEITISQTLAKPVRRLSIVHEHTHTMLQRNPGTHKKQYHESIIIPRSACSVSSSDQRKALLVDKWIIMIRHVFIYRKVYRHRWAHFYRTVCVTSIRLGCYSQNYNKPCVLYNCDSGCDFFRVSTS